MWMQLGAGLSGCKRTYSHTRVAPGVTWAYNRNFPVMRQSAQRAFTPAFIHTLLQGKSTSAGARGVLSVKC